MRALGLILALALPAPAAAALTLDLPGAATLTAERSDPATSHAVSVGPWAEGRVERIAAEGAVTQAAWRLRGSELSTLQLLRPLRDQLSRAGYEILFECETDGCGGYDFRYENDILPEPEMHVDLGDFRYLAARRPGEAADYVTLFVSRSSESGFVQLTRIGPPEEAPVTMATSTKTPDATAATEPALGDGIAARLQAEGTAALDDLVFETGASRLGEGPFGSLADLAAFLIADPARRVTLVGHTDAQGTLAANIALSKRRAAAVAERLVVEYGVAPEQIEAEGVGFLAPRASNASEEGRVRNRRVEAMLTEGGEAPGLTR